MKVKSITITGMHKVARATYPFNDVTYLVGPNGVGKSTVLQAVKLALLGYIPGYAKTGESIMKHASGPVMSVELELDEGIQITRTWSRSGSSVKTSLDVVGYNGELSDLFGEVQLPIFDFNEFRSMTANKLKDWFISFLPKSDDGLDIPSKLVEALGSRGLPYESLLSEIESWIAASDFQGVDLVRNLNAKLKEDQSFTKGQIDKLQSTIQSLVKYDDVQESDPDDIQQRLASLNAMKSELVKYQASLDLYNRTKANVDALRSSLPAARPEDDSRIQDSKSKVENLRTRLDVLKADYQDLMSKIHALEVKKASVPKSASTCPFTKEFCQTASELATASQNTISQIDNEIASKKSELVDCCPAACSKIEREIFQLTTEQNAILNQYDRLVAAELQLSSISVGSAPCDMSIHEIDEQMRALNESLVQIAANKRYEELSDKIVADKFKLENDLEVYKIWAKATDANGMQTELMNKPFQDLAEDMSKYLSQMFNGEVVANFNLSAKANSFSFGLLRGKSYIEFDYLSSGEKALFTLALILCILNRSGSKVKTILIDDILDHLDTENASYLFSALKNVKDVQFILAGVKECNDASICLPINQS